jgi:hypothetical protein
MDASDKGHATVFRVARFPGVFNILLEFSLRGGNLHLHVALAGMRVVPPSRAERTRVGVGVGVVCRRRTLVAMIPFVLAPLTLHLAVTVQVFPKSGEEIHATVVQA